MPRLSAWSALASFRHILRAFGVAGGEVTLRFMPNGLGIRSTHMRTRIEGSYFDYYGGANVVVKLLAADVLNLVHNWGDDEIITLQLDSDRTRLVCTYEAEDRSYVRVRGIIYLSA